MQFDYSDKNTMQVRENVAMQFIIIVGAIFFEQ